MDSLRPTVSIKPELSLLVALVYQTTFHRNDEFPEEIFRSEAIATALTVGQGSTFEVLRQQVPKLRPVFSRSQVDGIVITKTSSTRPTPLPDWIVYKVISLEFADDGQAIPDHRHRLASALLELLVLSHEPVVLHPFLPTIYGFAWSQNQYLRQQRIPVPIVDWADCGDLASYQRDLFANCLPSLSLQEKRRLSWQIGTALHFLHCCEIYHGDIKTENVLLFRQNDGSLHAKLTDFGMSVVSQHGVLRHLPPGTCAWAAPEIRKSLPHIDLVKADTFSFGLLVWRIFCDGHDPLFRLFLARSVISSSTATDLSPFEQALRRPSDNELEQIMDNDDLLTLVALPYWFINLTSYIVMRKCGAAVPIDVRELVHQLGSPPRSDLVGLNSLPKISDVLTCALSRNPSRRSLETSLLYFNQDGTFETPHVAPKTVEQTRPRLLRSASLNSPAVSWPAMRELQPRVRNFIMACRVVKAEQTTLNDTQPETLLLGNAACQISGMGSNRPPDPTEALSWITLAARKGSREAGGILWRMHNVFEKDVPDNIDIVAKLHEASYLGSVAAMEDLKIVAGESVGQARWQLQYQCCGIGSDIYFNNNCLNGWSFAQRDRCEWIKPILDGAKGHPQHIRVDKRGDNFLHAAVTLKYDDLMLQLLDLYGFDIDAVNSEGETPLLCALRTGSVTQAHTLLDRGANPCITSLRGESPMHWVLSSTEFGYLSLLNKIIEKGGLQTITTWAKICDYAAIYIESFHHYSERLCVGTPLHWAVCRKKARLVELLLRRGAPIDFKGTFATISAADLAAYLHEADILRLLLRTQKQRDYEQDLEQEQSLPEEQRAKRVRKPEERTVWGGAGIIRSAIDGSDRYSLVLRHGDRYRSYLRRTFCLLGKEFGHTAYGGGIDQQGRTAIQYAAYKGYEDAARLILKYLGRRNDINEPYGNEYWTPICDSIYRNHVEMFDMLLEHGADVHVRVDNPIQQGSRDWGALHIAARMAVDGDLRIAQRLIELGVPVDGYASDANQTESPLFLAIENDAFELANFLRHRGADINARSALLLRGKFKLSVSVNILGRIIASNMRYSRHRLNYLLYPPDEIADLEQIETMILPVARMNILHWSVFFPFSCSPPRMIDKSTQLEIIQILLERYNEPEIRNAKDGIYGFTMLHYAVSATSVQIIKHICDEPYSWDFRVRDNLGRTPLEVAAMRLSVALNLDQTMRQNMDEVRAYEEIIECLTMAESQLEEEQEQQDEEYEEEQYEEEEQAVKKGNGQAGEVEGKEKRRAEGS